jgi:DNA-binding FadR family transcriptional regulator
MVQERNQTLNKLREMINGGSARLPPERTLAQKFGVSRRLVRAALERLESEGQISRRQGSGTFVSGSEGEVDGLLSHAIEKTNPVEVLEVRLTLEPMLARLAAVRASKTDIEKLMQLAEATDKTTTPEAYEKADAAFHRYIAVTARNALFLGVFDAMLAAIEGVSWHGVRETSHCSKNKAIYAGFHRDIAAAVARRDFAEAEDLMSAHLMHVQEHVLSATQPRSAMPRGSRSEQTP